MKPVARPQGLAGALKYTKHRLTDMAKLEDRLDELNMLLLGGRSSAITESVYFIKTKLVQNVVGLFKGTPG